MYNLIKDFCFENLLTDNTRYDVNLVIEELVTNTISYGYIDNNVHEIKIDLILKGDALYVDITNDADAFNPLDYPDPNITAPANERQPGGLGIFFAKVLTDEISYYRRDNRNYMSFKKLSRKSG